MSIRIRLQQLMAVGDIVFRPPIIVSRGVNRDVFVSPAVNAFLEFQGIDPRFARASGRALAKIDTFSSGRKIVFGLNPSGKSPATLVSRNAPWRRGIVELRVCSYKPDVRIFGGFVDRDVLALLTWAPKDGINYRDEVRRCRSEWDRMFPGMSPLIGNHHDDYLTNFLPG